MATADGAIGDPDHAPYDRIIATVGTWDIPPTWWTQLRPGGRLVVPLRWRGQTRSIAFIRDTDRLCSNSVELCGFVPMLGQDGEHTAPLDPDGHVSLHWDIDQPIDPTALRGILDQPKSVTWSTVTVGGEESFDGIWLRLTATEPGTCRIAATSTAVDSGQCTPAIPIRTPAVVEHDSIAYLAMQRGRDRLRWTLGAIGHGQSGAQLARRLTDQIENWNTNRTAHPLITAYQADTADHPDSAHRIRKHHVRLVLSY